MRSITAACLRLFCFHRRRWSSMFLLLISCLLLLFLSFSGYLEECLSRALPIFYPNPSPLSPSRLSSIPVPPFLLSPANACSPPPLLLILVSSAPSHRDRRDGIRQTWGSLSSATASSSLTLFVLAVPDKAEERSALVHEAVTHGDIIQANFTDSYRNLTIKTLTGLAWAVQKCQGARFVLKTDDDVFVNTLALSSFLKDQQGLRYLGRVHWHVAPLRDPENRHYTARELYTGSHFPPYCSGTGYILSHGAVGHLLQEAGNGPWPSLEDVYIGILAKQAGIAPRQVAKIAGASSIPHNSCCYRTMFTSHKLTPRGMQEAWNMVKGEEEHWCPPLTLLFCRSFGQPLDKGENGDS
ncbi:PREDICTED: beta-1,3-galactosyltransferase 4 [Nanorana parkeri]|uniref:beta-1,3-galactosyltransferase 4 n=1 Tax=Nanorana parkeri TaxID=125878 RepID=UPI00085413B5|nr:PREDICTED: beta-1,3-galactosyltransferase 4 [Nanorana parkeri]